MRRIFILVLIAAILFSMMACEAENVKRPYYFFVYNSDIITDEDFSAICGLHKLYPDYEIVMLDVSGLTSASEVYVLLKTERDARAKDPSGIQILGNAGAVPTFIHRYEIETFTISEISEMALYDDFVSDYFYTNFDNNPDELNGISPYQLYGKLTKMNIIPKWPVVRLPLSRGQYSDFSAKYREYLSILAEQESINISIASPIFPVGWYSVAIDDTGYFLMRARDEWGIVDNLQMYSTTKGVYASTLPLNGSCNAGEWAHLTDENICEIYHDSHAGKNVLLQTIFDGRTKDEYHCEAILEEKTINAVLDGKPYLLNTFGCEPAKDMTSNIITTALSGRCVGAIASTTLVNNVDVDCMMSVEGYDTGYTKYSLLYEYLLSKHSGTTRTEAFHAGQLQVAVSLTENTDTLHPHSLQTNLCNLLGIHVFGILDP